MDSAEDGGTEDGGASPMVEADGVMLPLPVVELATPAVADDASGIIEEACFPNLEECIPGQAVMEPESVQEVKPTATVNPTSTENEQERVEPRSMRPRKPPTEPPSSRKRRRLSTRDATTPSDDSKRTQTPNSEELDSKSGKRRMVPRRPGISWVVGARLEAMDFLKNWYPARVVEVDDPEHEVLIHFDGWNSRFDEWLDMKSDRLRAMGSHSSGPSSGPSKTTDAVRPTSLPQVSLPKIQEGSVVLAKWKSGRFSKRYPAKVKCVKSKTLMDIEFYDGMECEVSCDTVQKLPASLQNQALHIWSLMNEINDAETKSSEDRRSRRDVMEAKKTLQDKIDESESLLAKLIDSASSLTAKVSLPPDKKVSSAAQKQLDSKPPVKAASSEGSRVAAATSNKAKPTKPASKNTMSPATSAENKPNKKAIPPQKVYTSKKAQVKQKGKLVVAGLFKDKPSKTSPGKSEPNALAEGKLDSVTCAASKPTLPEEQSSHEKDLTEVKSSPTVEASASTAVDMKDVKVSVTGIPETKLATADIPKVSETDAVDTKPPVTDAADVKPPAVDVTHMKTLEICVRDVKSPVASVMDVTPTSLASPEESVVSAVHVGDSMLSKNTAPVVKLECRTTRARRHSSEKSQPLPPEAPVGYAMVLESVDAKPAKAFVVEEDHNQFKCPHCSKSFRKDALLQAHVKHYHSSEGRRSLGGRKRRKTLSHCSSDSEARTPNSTTSSTPLASPIPSTTIPSVHKSLKLPAHTQGSTRTTGHSLLSLGSPRDPAPPDYYMEVDTDEEADEEDSSSNQSEIVNCVCGFNEEDGLMIQCELCCCWQHAECFHIDQEEQPERYLCYLCTDTPGIRQSSRYMHNQDWYRKGALPKLDFLMSISSDGSRREGIIKESHKHLVQLHNTINSLKSMEKLIDSAKKRDMYELALWSPADYPTPSEDASTSNSGHISEPILEQCNLIRHIDTIQREMEEQLLAIDKSVTDLENDAGVSSCTSADQLTASSNVLKRLMDDISKVQKLTSLTRTTSDPQ